VKAQRPILALVTARASCTGRDARGRVVTSRDDLASISVRESANALRSRL
jgi:hypothetical protein